MASQSYLLCIRDADALGDTILSSCTLDDLKTGRYWLDDRTSQSRISTKKRVHAPSQSLPRDSGTCLQRKCKRSRCCVVRLPGSVLPQKANPGRDNVHVECSTGKTRVYCPTYPLQHPQIMIIYIYVGPHILLCLNALEASLPYSRSSLGGRFRANWRRYRSGGL
jgi:hypothetical protein